MADRGAAQADRGPAGLRPALLFPGQGAQRVGMGRELLQASPAARSVFEQADDQLGRPLSRLCLEGPEEALTRTENLQPALYTVSIAAWRCLEPQLDGPAAAAMGHSLGEYAALVAAGALSFAAGLRAVDARGRAMAEAVEPGSGGMAAVIGLEAEAVQRVCAEVVAAAEPDGVLALANHNSPGQVVVSGQLALIDRAEPRLREAGARGLVRLKVSAPFHCALMRPAADRLAAVLAELEFSAPRLPVLSNVTGRPHGQPDEIRRRLVEQVTEPVRWVDCVRWTQAAGVDRYLEVGPGRVLAGLLKRIDRRARVSGVATPEQAAAARGFIGGEARA
jgi:[acyl-carrier-protein] S-malonyltransferase